MVRRGAVIVWLAAVALLAAPGAAFAATQTASSRGITATFSFTGAGVHSSNLHLKITRAGRVMYDQPVRAPSCERRCVPFASGHHQSSVHIYDLAGNGQPDVVLELYSGGAHCCFIDEVYYPNASSSKYLSTGRDFGNAGAAIRRLSGNYVFLSTDNAFYYEFSDFADSGAPIQIFRFVHNKFAVVTRSYPSLIASDAATWWKAFTQDYSNGTGLIAPWAADEDLLGNFSQVQSTLQTELRQNHLNSPGPPWPSGRQFITALNKFLAQHGYQASG
jgi:hypothetical protein